jgi:shikimate kinase
MAEKLGALFLDFDQEIERRTGTTIAQIFAEEGETAFRKLERDLTAELASKPAMVLAPGGGWIADQRNVAALRPPARIIHLLVDVPTALRRLGPSGSGRPLLAGGAVEARLEELATARMPLYGSADATIDTQTLTPQQVAQNGLRLAYAWGWPIG